MAHPVSGFPPSELATVLENRQKDNMLGKLRSLLNINENDGKEGFRNDMLDYNEGKEGVRSDIPGKNLFTHRLIYGANILLTIFIIIGILMVSYRG
jgi:hypothetical protein